MPRKYFHGNGCTLNSVLRRVELRMIDLQAKYCNEIYVIEEYYEQIDICVRIDKLLIYIHKKKSYFLYLTKFSYATNIFQIIYYKTRT